jgi:hypothetical protein
MAWIIGNQMVACQAAFPGRVKKGKSDPTNHRRRKVVHRRRAELLHRVAGLRAEDRKHARDEGLAARNCSKRRRLAAPTGCDDPVASAKDLSLSLTFG